MTRPSGRPRGRPKGSGEYDDGPMLDRIASRAARDGIPATTAMKREGVRDPSDIRRLQHKWKERARKIQTAAKGGEEKSPVRRPVTEADIAAAMTPRGGWTRATLAEWGVPWPPPKGWRKTLVESGVPERAEPGEEVGWMTFPVPDSAERWRKLRAHPSFRAVMDSLKADAEQHMPTLLASMPHAVPSTPVARIMAAVERRDADRENLEAAGLPVDQADDLLRLEVERVITDMRGDAYTFDASGRLAIETPAGPVFPDFDG